MPSNTSEIKKILQVGNIFYFTTKESSSILKAGVVANTNNEFIITNPMSSNKEIDEIYISYPRIYKYNLLLQDGMFFKKRDGSTNQEPFLFEEDIIAVDKEKKLDFLLIESYKITPRVGRKIRISTSHREKILKSNLGCCVNFFLTQNQMGLTSKLRNIITKMEGSPDEEQLVLVTKLIAYIFKNIRCYLDELLEINNQGDEVASSIGYELTDTIRGIFLNGHITDTEEQIDMVLEKTKALSVDKKVLILKISLLLLLQKEAKEKEGLE